MTDGLYVYAIVHAGRTVPPDLTGVGDTPAPVRVVSEGRVGAVVGGAPPKLRPRRRDLLAHQAVLLELVGGGPLLPMRFGTVAADEASVRTQLAAAEDRHLVALEHVTGRAEMNVKALAVPDALPLLVREDSTIRRLRDEARKHPAYEANLRLGEAVSSALTHRASVAGRQVRDELAALAHAVAAGPDASGCVLNTSFLVDTASVGAFERAAQRLAEARRGHVELRISGPLPCYSFVEPEGALQSAGA